jgi:hypothetical protein
MASERDVHIQISLEGEVNFVTFQVTVRDLETVLRDIEQRITRANAKIEWRWGDDAIIRAVASPNGVEESVIAQIVKEARLGFERVANADGGNINWPPSFGPKAKNALTRVVKQLEKVNAITVDTEYEPPLVIDRVVLKEEIGRKGIPTEVTSVDGKLDLISVRGRPYFSIEEHGTGKRIRCILSEDLFDRAKDSLGRRVVVDGTMRFTRNGEPWMLTNITSLWSRPDEKRKLEELQGLIPDFIEGESAEDYVHNMRGEPRGGNDDQ